MKLVCKQNFIPAKTETRGLAFLKHEHVIHSEIKLPITKGKTYSIMFDHQSYGHNYVTNEFHVYIFTDNNKWEKFSFEPDVVTILDILNNVFEAP